MKICSATEKQYVNVQSPERITENRVHILYIENEKIAPILNIYPETRRIIVPASMSKMANIELKGSNIKWYVTNNVKVTNMLKFFKQHNKIAWNFSVQMYDVHEILSVCEVVITTNVHFNEYAEIFKASNSDIILLDA